MPRGRPPKNTATQKTSSAKTTTTKKRHYFTLIYPEGTSIAEEDVVKVKEQLSEIKDKPEETRIDLIIHSWGGDIYSAFKIINVIRAHCTELNAIVPIRAVSAGTLIALGADWIYMDNTSQLGPLDLPTEHPTIEGTKVSAIDCIQSIAYVEGILRSTATNRYEELRAIGLGRKTAVSLAFDVAIKFTQPLVSKLDPIQTSKSSRELEIATIYGKDLLKKYMLKTNIFSIRNSNEIITKLVYNYPTHGFAIWAEEARRIGLAIKTAKDYADWEKAYKLVNILKSKERKALWHMDEDLFEEWVK